MMKLSAEGLLRRSIALATGAGAAMFGTAGPAVAEEGDATQLEKVEITGTRIRRVDAETASPVYTIDRATITATGAQTVGQFLQDIPSISGAATNPQVNNGGGTGAAVVSLRGLGEQRTLVLVNGRRVLPGVNTTVEGVDVNAIPINLIERVEVLKEGASAIYGSDAIGGVVNFITRKDFNGGEVALDYGFTTKHDGKRKGASMSWGASTGKANILLGLNYNHQDGISAGDREFSRNALYLYGGVVTAGGSSRVPTGRVFFPDTDPDTDGVQDPFGFGCGSVTRIDGTSGATPADYRCFTGGDLFNYQPFNLILTPQERAGLFTVANYKVYGDIEAYAEVFYNTTQSGFEIAPLPFDSRADDVVISGDNIYNPFGVDLGGADAVNQNATWRMNALGNRRSEVETNAGQANIGLRGGIMDTLWRWDAGFSFGRVHQNQDIFGYLFTPTLKQALGPSFVDPENGPTCGTAESPIAGCVPLNIFNLPLALTDPAQAAQFAAISAGYNLEATRSQRIYTANFNGPIFRLPAGPIQGAVGFERREQFLSSTVAFLAQGRPPDFLTCALAQETCTNETGGSLTSNEFYGEVFVPVIADVPGAKALNLIGGVRYSDYDRFGSTTNGKVALEYRPIGDLLVRGSWAQVFRAPTITDLFLSITANAPTFNDPCEGLTEEQVAANPNFNLACEHVTPDGTFAEPNSQVTGRFRGNENLKPETGTVLTAGLVYDPEYVPGLSSEIDFWRYNLEDTLEPVDVNSTALICVATGAPEFCGLINRFDDGTVNYIDQPILNLGEIVMQGVDMGVKYRLPTTPAGKFRISLDATYIDEFDRTPAPGFPIVLHNAGTFSRQDGNFARWRGLASVDWSLLDFTALMTVRYVGRFTLQDADTIIPDVDIRYGSHTYVDMSIGYKVPRVNTQLLVGMNNMFDKQPPLLYQNNVTNANTDVETFDTVGRSIFFKVVQKF